MNTPRTTLYRDKQNGKIFGVCAGIADYTGVNVFWIRLGLVLLTMMTFPLAPMAYWVAGFWLKKKPLEYYADPQQERYWQRVRQSPARTAREVRARFRDIDRRLADVETYYVTSNPRLSAEIERLR